MISIDGHSGCSLEIKQQDYKTVIRKSSFSKDYSPRLRSQAQKQKLFCGTPAILAPPVCLEGVESEKYWFEMEYIQGYDFISFVERAGPRELTFFWETLRAFLLREISSSDFIDYPKDAFVRKVDEVYNKIKSPNAPYPIEEAVNFISGFDSRVPFPAGECHGDLTFSNMVISKDLSKIYFIDFLDNFYNSPLQDIAKLRQDTVHGWTLRKCTRKFDSVKTNLCLRFLDEKLFSLVQESVVLSTYYRPVQLLNILRILVYTKDRSTYNYLLKCLEHELQNEFNITSCW